MTRHRSFDTQEPEEREPVTFDVKGETFTCAPEIPGPALLDFFTGLASGNDALGSNATLSFLTAAMTIDCVKCEGSGQIPTEEGHEDCDACGGDGDDINEYIRFRKFAKDRRNHVDLKKIMEIGMYLSAEYGLRPTRPGSGSQPGPGSTSDGSEATEPSEA